MNQAIDLQRVETIIHSGGIIAYPTEAVYGLGCDPYNQTAINKLFAIKQRNPNKQMILIASTWQQIENLIDLSKLPDNRLNEIMQTWPGPVTWVMPASELAPKWLKGDDQSIALRISAHPLVQTICNHLNQAIVSTSANVSQQEPARSYNEVEKIFANQIDYIIPGETGGAKKPSMIYHAVSKEVLRK